MAQNDLIETLQTAEYPIHLFHGVADELVSYANLPDVNANPYLSLRTLPESFDHTYTGNVCVGQVGIGFIVTYDASLYAIEEKHFRSHFQKRKEIQEWKEVQNLLILFHCERYMMFRM